MGWVKRLFGHGKVLVEFELTDGRTGTAKIPFEGSLDSMTEKEFCKYASGIAEVEHGYKISKMRILNYYGCNSYFREPTGDWVYLGSVTA